MTIATNKVLTIYGLMFGENINNRKFSLELKIDSVQCFYSDIEKTKVTRIKLVNIYNNDVFYLEIKEDVKNIDLLYIEGILFSQTEEFTSKDFVIVA